MEQNKEEEYIPQTFSTEEESQSIEFVDDDDDDDEFDDTPVLYDHAELELLDD
jgi:hypothetical protein